jgi:hypothetical protein
MMSMKNKEAVGCCLLIREAELYCQDGSALPVNRSQIGRIHCRRMLLL